MYAGDDSKLTITQEAWGERFLPTGEHELRWTTDWGKGVSLSVSTFAPEWPKWAFDVGVEFAPKFGQDYYRYETGYSLMQVRRDGDYFVDAKVIKDVWTGRYVWKPEPGVVYRGTDWRTFAGELKSKPDKPN